MNNTASDLCIKTEYIYTNCNMPIIKIYNNESRNHTYIREINKKLDVLYGKAPAYCSCSKCRTDLHT